MRNIIFYYVIISVQKNLMLEFVSFNERTSFISWVRSGRPKAVEKIRKIDDSFFKWKLMKGYVFDGNVKAYVKTTCACK
jgi:hypothetical protein